MIYDLKNLKDAETAQERVKEIAVTSGSLFMRLIHECTA